MFVSPYMFVTWYMAGGEKFLRFLPVRSVKFTVTRAAAAERGLGNLIRQG